MKLTLLQRIAALFSSSASTTSLPEEKGPSPYLSISSPDGPASTDDNQKYYGLMLLREDEQGMIASYSLPFRSIHTGDRPLQFVGESLNLWCHTKATGKDRLANFQWVKPEMGAPSLLISDSVKRLLLSFSIPTHCFHPATLDPPRIEEVETDYHVLQLGYDSLLKELQYPVSIEGLGSRYEPVSRRVGKISPLEVPDIQNYEAFETESRRLQKEGVPYGYPALMPYRFLLSTAHDVYTYRDEIIINEFVKEALERHFPGEFETYELNLPPIRINPDRYADKREKYADLSVAVDPLRYIFSDEDEDRFAMTETYLSGDYEVPEEAYGDDEFSAAAKRLKLVFPTEFKRFYRGGLPSPTYWELENLNRIYPLENMDFTGPEATGAIAFAGNGMGDYLVLPRRSDSPYILSKYVYFADHETDELTMIAPLEGLSEWILEDSEGMDE